MSFKCLILTAVVITAQCSVIKIQEIPISDDMLMKIVIKEGSSDQSHKIASIKIDLEKIEPEGPPKYTKYDPEQPIHDSQPRSEDEEIIPPPNHPGLHLGNPLSESPKPQESKEVPPIIISESKIVTPTTIVTEDRGEETTPKKEVVPNFENRFGIGTDICGSGRIRKGRFCIPAGK
ncbi:uncharacterized protein LOC121728135 [Aricia agestis]|uniref:uncharacterized protein LOC121728135 n=1 Tax=Aricia agestis TaxID=91739 RepID=UPI001C20773F|nr:uncharacterized protein LOC121728135 [Aricia agestis]